MPGCITAGPKSVARTMGQCRSATTSTVVQRYWYCASSYLSGAILNTRLYLLPLHVSGVTGGERGIERP